MRGTLGLTSEPRTRGGHVEYTGTLGTGHRQAHGLRLQLTLGF